MELIDDPGPRFNDQNFSGYRLAIEEYLRKGVRIFREAPELFLLYTIIYLILSPIGAFLITAPLAAGFYIIARKIDRRQSFVFEDFFDGFKDFISLLMMTILTAVIVTVGLAFCILPGIYLGVGYTFSIFFIIFEKMDFWEAMEASRKLVSREWFSVFGLVIILALINFIGILAFGIGILFTIPITFAALYAAFDDIYNSQKKYQA